MSFRPRQMKSAMYGPTGACRLNLTPANRRSRNNSQSLRSASVISRRILRARSVASGGRLYLTIAPSPGPAFGRTTLSPNGERVTAGTAVPLRRLAARQEFAHALERAQDVLGRIGVRQPHVALAENAEVGP